MRFLVYGKKHSNLLLGLQLPLPAELSLLEEAAPELYNQLFGMDKGKGDLNRLLVSNCLRLGKVYLRDFPEYKQGRSAKSVTVHRPNRVSIGPGKAVTGFSINGKSSSAKVANDGIRITTYCAETDTDSEFMIHCDTYPIDDGELRAKFSGGSGGNNFVHQLVSTLSKFAGTHVWVQIEY